MSETSSRLGQAALRNRKMTYSALYLAIALVLPFLTGQIPEIGAMLCPMHIPALLCGFVCGWPWGMAVGFISPLLRSVVFGMPSLFPEAVAMAFEMGVYGAAASHTSEKELEHLRGAADCDDRRALCVGRCPLSHRGSSEHGIHPRSLFGGRGHNGDPRYHSAHRVDSNAGDDLKTIESGAQ